MPRGDDTRVRRLAEEMSEQSCCALLRMCYVLGGGSESDFITDLEGPISCIIEGKNLPEIIQDKRSFMLKRWYTDSGAHLAAFESDLEPLWETVRKLT